jgi:oxygen-independent coproporphyrinogen-3 oxidase
LSLDFAALTKRRGIDLETHFERELEALDDFEYDGLVQSTRNGFAVTELGRLFVRNLAMCFDHTRTSARAAQHSRTI